MQSASGCRRTAAALVLCLVGVACSIEAPKIELVTQGVAASQGTTGSAAQNVSLGGSAGVPGAAVTGAAAKSCLGKATDVGITGDTIKLGSTFAVSGPVSNISGPILKGVQSYFNMINASGGIYGRKIALKWYDDGWDAQRGKAYIKRLVEQDKVFVLSTVPSSNGLDAAKTYLEQQQVPVFGTSGLIESQFQSPMDWPVGTSSKSAARIGLVTMKQLHAQSAAVIWLDLLAGREAMDAITNGIKPIIGKNPADFLVNTAGYRVSISEPDFGPVWARIINDTKDFQSAHHQSVTGRPDYVVFAIDPTNAIKALQAAENIDFRPKIGWGGAAPLFLNLVPQSSDYAAKTGLRAGTSYYPPLGAYLNRPAVQNYINTVRRYYGSSVDLNNPYLEGGYAGAALTVEVIKRAGPCLTRAAVINAANHLTDFSAAGLTPPLTFRAGSTHYGNIRGLNVQVTPSGDWQVIGDFVADPFPGRN
jgi:branched-chain amino acid transport system substrate-binding protein